VAAAPLHRRLLAASGAASYVLVFLAFLLWERPGLGVAHFYYISIALVALATGPRIGVVAGVVATALYTTDVVINPSIPSREVLTASTVVRLVTYAAIGLLIGWFARDNRILVGQLQVLAERDALTGLPNTRAFEAAINRRLEKGEPFALLIGDMDELRTLNEDHGQVEADDALHRLATTLGAGLRPEDEIARVGGDEFAVLSSARTAEDAARMAATLERLAASAGSGITFGWGVYPREGVNALTLYRVADERLYARKLIRGQRRGNTVAFRPRAAARPEVTTPA
jgi:diguanylate cyclase (GGDEF)-like protein